MRNTATHFKLQRRRMTGFFACALTFISIASATAQPINVPSFSFETPIAPVDSGNPNFDNWQENPEPLGFDPGGGLDWSFRAGVFRAPAIVPDGDQAAYLFNTPGIGIYQQLTETYQPGLSYDLIVGVHPGITRPPTAGDQLRISLSYDNAGTLVPIQSTEIVFDAGDFPDPFSFYDYGVSVSDVQNTDAWSGENIVVQFEALSGDGSGTWDLDNVRLTVVPEPSAILLLAGGLGFGWFAIRTRRKA